MRRRLDDGEAKRLLQRDVHKHAAGGLRRGAHAGEEGAVVGGEALQAGASTQHQAWQHQARDLGCHQHSAVLTYANR